MEHECGRAIDLVWEGDRVTEAVASDGRRVRYRYDPAGRVVAATGPLGTRTYRWGEDGRMSAVIDADGVVEAENAYDSAGRVVRQRSPFRPGDPLLVPAWSYHRGVRRGRGKVQYLDRGRAAVSLASSMRTGGASR